MNSKAVETLELRLTPQQVAAIRLRNQRRKKNVGGTGELDLGDISSVCESKRVYLETVDFTES